jgi:hypothetical protein
LAISRWIGIPSKENMEERRHGKFELFGLKWIPGFDLQFLQYYIGPKIDIGLIPEIRQACFIKVIETFETEIFDCFFLFVQQPDWSGYFIWHLASVPLL